MNVKNNKIIRPVKIIRLTANLNSKIQRIFKVQILFQRNFEENLLGK